MSSAFSQPQRGISRVIWNANCSSSNNSSRSLSIVFQLLTLLIVVKYLRSFGLVACQCTKWDVPKVNGRRWCIATRKHSRQYWLRNKSVFGSVATEIKGGEKSEEEMQEKWAQELHSLLPRFALFSKERTWKGRAQNFEREYLSSITSVVFVGWQKYYCRETSFLLTSFLDSFFFLCYQSEALDRKSLSQRINSVVGKDCSGDTKLKFTASSVSQSGVLSCIRLHREIYSTTRWVVAGGRIEFGRWNVD